MNKTYIMAEAGVNHNGDIDTARKLIDLAIIAGCDGIKFQLFYKEEVPEVWDDIYHLHTGLNTLQSLKLYCGKDIDFHCSAFGIRSAMHLKTKLGLSTLKIPSGLITNEDFLYHVAPCFNKFILSTGMSTIPEIEKALEMLVSGNVVLLHCVSAYPTPLDELNLKAMLTLKKKFPECAIGISDHTLGILVPVAATALGAHCIEKHITLDTGMDGPDHKSSLSPKELFDMVRSVRDVELILGDGVKKCQESEKVNLYRRKYN